MAAARAPDVAGPATPGATADVRLLSSRLMPEAELAGFIAAHPAAGGIVSFVGQVRQGDSEGGDLDGGDAIEALELTHYEPLTLPAMRALAGRALARWPLHGLLIVHRVGVMRPGEPIVLVAAAARHRREAFAAVDFAMDHLKSDSWFWKREKTAGQWRWIEPRDVDHADLARWS